MILIADSGSTKTSWARVSALGDDALITTSPGINPAILSEAELFSLLSESLRPLIVEGSPSAVRFFGAGCRPDLIPRVRQMISEITSCHDVFVGSDMLGAAIALFANRPGIAAILGTGSNSCLYDGSQITANIPPLGFILGDEGSGTAIGKRLLSLLYKSPDASPLRREFEEATSLLLPDIINKVYRTPAPNVFLASLTRFISPRLKAHHELHNLVVDEFIRFFRLNILPYGRPELPVSFVGSIACHFSEQLHQAARQCHLSIGHIIPTPIHSLITNLV